MSYKSLKLKKEKSTDKIAEYSKKNTSNGITIISLVITIIILLVLASIIINLLFGKNGLITMAQKAKDLYEESIKREEEELDEIFKGKFADYNGGLRLDGINLKNQYNEQIQLRGFVAVKLLEDSQHAQDYEKKQFFSYYINQESINTLKTWGVNIIRIGLEIEDVENEKEMNSFIDTVDLLVKNNIYVIILLWNNGDPNQNIDIAKEYFKSIAEKYKDTPNILYEIANEPSKDLKWEELAEYSNTIIPIIREFSKDNIIIIPCSSLDMRPDQVNMEDLLQNKNIMISYHMYVGDGLNIDNIRIFRKST